MFCTLYVVQSQVFLMALTDVHKKFSALIWNSGVEQGGQIGFVKCRKRFNCLSD